MFFLMFRHANFYVITSREIMKSLKLKNTDLPALLMIPSDGDGFIRFSGEILEQSVSEWVLRNSAPGLDELTLSTPSGELYATQFFSSRKLKFILFAGPEELDEEALSVWRSISTLFPSKAIFAYMTQSDVADVVEYFNVDTSKDLPMIAAHQPASDSKYKSKKLDIHDKQQLQDFVVGVLTGLVPKVLKSEPLPKKQSGVAQRVVGSNVLDVVSKIDTDVLLAITVPGCAHCKRLLPAYELLGRAVQSESRILIARIDASANDLPSTWGVSDYPTLLWFPARDKPYKESTVPTPRQYWDAGFSLQELAGFVQRDSSFDPKSLRIATAEQLSSLQGDEDIYRAKFEEEERVQRRNEGRIVYEVPFVDWLLGEVVFDGKRWHLGAAAVLGVTWVLMFLCIIATQSAQKSIQKKKME
ncbi:hypothetical protein EON65_37945 [archaeon]|nr:MAG: hypothetical protein EON65_37945 [archaeon]